MAPATYNVFEIRAELRNEVTGEPHLHIYTADTGEAQAFYFTLAEYVGGGKVDILYHPNIWEGTIIYCCDECEAARHAYTGEYAAW